MTDLIGDIHGHANKLKALLLKLGYRKSHHTYSHPYRKVLFVGDYIDRGPKIRETLEIVKSMVDAGHAIALMGNHEYNALCFHFKGRLGGHLRNHLIKNIIQHYETLKQFQNRQTEYEYYLDWFKTLPLYYETDSFRSVHACWDSQNINYLSQTLDKGRLTEDLLYQSVNEGTLLYKAVDETLKGKEIKMPAGLFFTDKDGTQRTDIRIKWWEDPATMTYRSISVEPLVDLPEQSIDTQHWVSSNYYRGDEKKVFFGHYWLRGEPSLYRNNICCLDYSVAKGGKLVAYRLDDEHVLDEGKFVCV